MKKIILSSLIMFSLCACGEHVYRVTEKNETKSSKQTSAVESPKFEIKKKLTGGSAAAIPSATAFRMSGNYSDNVAITLSPSGEILYFPAPTDITAYSHPIELCDGWWLNCQGIGSGSVFTKYTFAEYAALPQAPTPEQLKAAIIPGAKVTQFIQLPMNINEAPKNIKAVNEYLKTL